MKHHHWIDTSAPGSRYEEQVDLYDPTSYRHRPWDGSTPWTEGPAPK